MPPSQSSQSQSEEVTNAGSPLVAHDYESRDRRQQLTDHRSEDSSLSMRSSFLRAWFAFCVLGTINNLSYVVINSAAKSLADSFNAGNLIGAVVWCNVGFGTGVRVINTVALLNTSYNARILASVAMMVVGCVGLAIGTWIDFWFCLCAVIIVGCFSSLGESVLLGYLKGFDSRLMGAWSTGTGVAGVGGTAMYLVMYSVIGLSNRVIFFAQVPLALIYWIAFRYVEVNRSRLSLDASDEPLAGVLMDGRTGSINESERESVLAADGATNVAGARDSPEVAGHALLIQSEAADSSAIGALESSDKEFDDLAHSELFEPWCTRFARVSRVIASPALQLAAVYFFEYVVSVGFASKANLNPPKDDWWKENAYELLSFAYQVGVLIARSSQSFIKIRRIELLTLLQAGHFVLWFLHVWLTDMVVVGLLGGAMYVNVFTLLLESRALNKPDQELGINLTAIAVNIGIMASACADIVLFVTIFKGKGD